MKFSACLTLLLALLAGTAQAIDAETFLPVAKGMMRFPDHPTEADFRAIEAKMDALPKFNAKDDDDQHGLLLSAAFLVAGHDAHGWAIANKGDVGHAALEIIAGKGSWAAWLRDDKAVNGDKLDVWWSGYLASQDDIYLVKLLRFAGSPAPKDDLGKAALIEVASWSFKSNCQQIRAVREFVKRRLNDPDYADKKTFFQSCLAEDGPKPAHK